MTILDPCMSLERKKNFLGVLGVVDVHQLLLITFKPNLLTISII